MAAPRAFIRVLKVLGPICVASAPTHDLLSSQCPTRRLGASARPPVAIVRAFLPCADLIAPSFRESQNMANAESELQARMAAAQREMAALQQIQADLKRQDKEFQTRMDGLRGKLEASSKALSAAEQKKQRLIKEAARIQKEMQEADAEIAKQTHLKSEITKSIVNMQELQATKKREQVDESLRGRQRLQPQLRLPLLRAVGARL